MTDRMYRVLVDLGSDGMWWLGVGGQIGPGPAEFATPEEAVSAGRRYHWPFQVVMIIEEIKP
jgi:hypothetical protein